MRATSIKDLKCPYCGYDGGDLNIGSAPIAVGLFFNYLDCSKCKERFKIIPYKK